MTGGCTPRRWTLAARNGASFSFCPPCASRAEVERQKKKTQSVELLSSLASHISTFSSSSFPRTLPPRAATMNCALKPSPRVTRSSGSAFANGGNSLAAPMRALSVASTSASRRPLTVEGRSSQNLGDKIVLRFCSPGNAPSFTLFLIDKSPIPAPPFSVKLSCSSLLRIFSLISSSLEVVTHCNLLSKSSVFSFNNKLPVLISYPSLLLSNHRL